MGRNEWKTKLQKVALDKTSPKLAINFLLRQYFLSVKNSFYHQVNGIPTDSDLAPFMAKFFFYHYENIWLLSTKKNNLVKGTLMQI